MRKINEKKVLEAVMYEIIPLHKNTKPFWRFLVMQNAWHYLEKGTNTQWAGEYNFDGGKLIKFNYIEILKNIRYCRRKQFDRFQKFPLHKVHIANLKWRLSLFKRNLYNPKNINQILLKETGY